MPTKVELTHLAPGDSVGFDSKVKIQYQPDVDGNVTEAKGFAPFDTADASSRFQTSTGGKFWLALSRSGSSPAPIELVDTELKGDAHANGKSIQFQLRGTAHVSEPNSEITILSGRAAVIDVPEDANFWLRLAMEGNQPVYKIVFAKEGKFPLTLDFVATLATPGGDVRSADFTVASQRCDSVDDQRTSRRS